MNRWNLMIGYRNPLTQGCASAGLEVDMFSKHLPQNRKIITICLCWSPRLGVTQLTKQCYEGIEIRIFNKRSWWWLYLLERLGLWAMIGQRIRSQIAKHLRNDNKDSSRHERKSLSLFLRQDYYTVSLQAIEQLLASSKQSLCNMVTTLNWTKKAEKLPIDLVWSRHTWSSGEVNHHKAT